MNSDVPSDILSVASRPGDHVWIGHSAPRDWISLNLQLGTNFRASSAHHQQYDTVWHFEELLHQGHFSRLELLLDEMLRLLKPDGLLVVRYQCELVAALKRFLTRRPFCKIEVENEWRRGGELISVFRIRRDELDRYRDTRWTFAMLTSGTKEPEVLKFLRSIRESPEGAQHEIIICGPPAASYEPFGVRYLDRTYREDLAEISKKKNDIATMASHPNLLVCHDRYWLNPDFFKGFERFGYDFDFVTVRQWLDTGEEYPSYCALNRGDLVVTATRMLHRYDALYPGHFINGGIFAIKTHTFRNLPLNPMLFWAQAEDVEFTHMLRDNSLPPRINIFSSTETQVTGPRGLETRQIYRIGLPPLPDDYTGPPPPETAPPPPASTPMETSPTPTGFAPISVHPPRSFLGLFLGSARAERMIALFRLRKKMIAAWGFLLLLHLLTLAVVVAIAVRVFR